MFSVVDYGGGQVIRVGELHGGATCSAWWIRGEVSCI